DPSNADRVLAVAIAGGAYAVFESADGGTTFGSMIYAASNGDAINGVEIARSDPKTVYLSLTSTAKNPKPVKSTDSGAHWTTTDLTTDLGLGLLRIISVDPQDPNTVLMRWSNPSGGEAIGVTRDGGTSASKPLSIANNFTSFARLTDGTLL